MDDFITSRTLTLSHQIPTKLLEKFWEGLKDGKVFGTCCKICRSKYYPPQADCPECLESNMEWFLLANTGILISFTKSNIKPQGFTHYSDPYTIGIAQLENGLKVMGWLETGKEIPVGSLVEVSSKVQPDGYPLVIFSRRH
jgi:uncharacterized OB-fold protein